VLFATILASSMAFIDGTALNVAMPALQASLRASGASLLWIINGYALMLASGILVGGSLGDHYGRKRIYMLGILVFAGASPPAGLDPATAAQVRTAIRLALVDVFRVIALVCAGLAWLSAGLAWLTVDNRLLTPPAN
jgi:MFS family permease